jgi:hypothetical protein
MNYINEIVGIPLIQTLPFLIKNSYKATYLKFLIILKTKIEMKKYLCTSRFKTEKNND